MNLIMNVCIKISGLDCYGCVEIRDMPSPVQPTAASATVLLRNGRKYIFCGYLNPTIKQLKYPTCKQK